MADGPTIHALDTQTQEVYWRYDVRADVRCGLLVQGNALYAATKGRKVFAFEW